LRLETGHMIRAATLCATIACLGLAGAVRAADPGDGARGAPAAYRVALRSANVPIEAAALVIRPLDAGPIRVEDRGNAAMSPASTLKLVTTWVALNRLGPGFRWRTDALASGAIRQGTLEGHLALRGSGDPALVVENLWLLVQRIRGFGIRAIRGDVLLDRSAFAPVVVDPESFDGAELRAYNVGPDALLVNFKAVTFDFVPDPASGTARIVVTPALAGARIPQAVRGVDGPCGDWRARLQGDFSTELAPAFRGAYPLDCGTRSWHVNLLEPTAYFEAVFRAMWEGGGGTWSGHAVDAAVPADARPVANFESRTLPEVIRDINKFSNNVMARQLFLTLGRSDPAATPAVEPATAARAAAAVRETLAAQGLVMPELVLENGSGLSRNERIAPANLASLLESAWRSPLAPEFISSLPLTGVDGTARKRTAAAGNAHIKTGMLNGVRAIAGYVQAGSGRHYVIVAIINHANAGAAQAAHDALLDWVQREG
jgi:serine-type D-Ala-D-Ala carboxypeptidase/endopeptidase (penicillin-binding protein 4)